MIMSDCNHEFVCLAWMALGLLSSYLWSIWRNEFSWGLVISSLILVGYICVFRLSLYVAIVAFVMFLAGLSIALVCRNRKRDVCVVATSIEYPDFFLCFALVHIAALLVRYFRDIIR